MISTANATRIRVVGNAFSSEGEDLGNPNPRPIRLEIDWMEDVSASAEFVSNNLFRHRLRTLSGVGYIIPHRRATLPTQHFVIVQLASTGCLSLP